MKYHIKLTNNLAHLHIHLNQIIDKVHNWLISNATMWAPEASGYSGCNTLFQCHNQWITWKKILPINDKSALSELVIPYGEHLGQFLYILLSSWIWRWGELTFLITLNPFFMKISAKIFLSSTLFDMASTWMLQDMFNWCCGENIEDYLCYCHCS